MMGFHAISRYLQPLALLGALFLLSLIVIHQFLPGSSFGVNNSGAGPWRPYAYRVLVPTITDMLYQAIPQSVEDNVTPTLIQWRDGEFGERVLGIRADADHLPKPLRDAYIFQTTLKIAVVYLTLLAFIGMLYYAARVIFPHNRVYAGFSTVIALLVLPVIVRKFAYTYDFAELFFSCAAFTLLYQKRWPLYFVCLVFATLNKETSAFIIFFYVIWFFRRLPMTEYALLLIAQLLIFACIKTGLSLYYAGLPGSALALCGWNCILHSFTYSYTALLSIGAIFLLIGYDWRSKPAFLRAGLWMLAPNLIAYLVFGFPGEYRAFYWSMPVMVLLAAHTLVRVLGLEQPILMKKTA